MYKLNDSIFDVSIIGGGFYGCILAIFLSKFYKKILLIEKETNLLTKASYINQARVHNGYHYPRSYITALSSHQNFKKFCDDFPRAVNKKHTSLYAIASQNSKVTANQFYQYCRKIGSPIRVADKELQSLFNKNLIENVFQVEEYVFSGNTLRDILNTELKKVGAKVIYNSEVASVNQGKNSTVEINLINGLKIKTLKALNCTYAQLNSILQNSKLPLLPLKFELTEMPLVVLPDPYCKLGITIMDGPFFSILPYPDKKAHTIHHVRYTPRMIWDGSLVYDDHPKESNYNFMIKDVKRYIPQLNKVTYKDSLYQTKSILVANEANDARPILFHKNYFLKNFHIVLGGKIDNVYDILHTIADQGL